MNVIVDLDGVICTEEKTFERALAKPIDGAAQKLEELSFLGHHIIIYTARSWSEERVTKVEGGGGACRQSFALIEGVRS